MAAGSPSGPRRTVEAVGDHRPPRPVGSAGGARGRRHLDRLRPLGVDRLTVHSGSSGLRVEATPDVVGRLAAFAGIPVLELRAGDGGLEDLFLQQTTERPGRGPQHEHPARHHPSGRGCRAGGASRAGRAPPARTPHEPGRDRIPFSRLTRVELRKMVDTRSGRWLLVLVGAAIVVAVAGVFVTNGQARGLGDQLEATTFSMTMLLPVVGILAVTTEFSQRTGLVTFSLEPRRGRVAAAEVVVTLVVAAGAVASVMIEMLFGLGVWRIGRVEVK